ncbi:hypothetical protein NDN08_001103 [Rhodosorus marinus]|uniref:MutL C-terminal dimerisation domain-containing protein n=1 Tax=Rhodosorus marinus TaxID=101924 RepID=A0AAV8UPV2_9RHOD|nr:hypothetical protein NDN08_001103 [Rhodosorus marinus]
MGDLRLSNDGVRGLNERTARIVSACARVGSYAEAIGELVVNSLEAGATDIRVEAAPSALRLSVVDNGHGVNRSSLELLGAAGASSKGLSDGYRGSFLAALSSVASVEVRTRCGSGPVLRKWLRHGETLFVGDEEFGLLERGTSVDVWEMYQNVPVRKRTLAQAELGPDDQLDASRHVLSVLSLFHPDTGFHLTDGTRTIIKDERRSSEAGAWLERLGGVLGPRAGAQLVPLPKHSFNGFNVDGFSTEEPVVSYGLGDSQFLCINGRVCGDDELVRMIKKAWKRSFAKAGRRDEVPHRKSPAFLVKVKCSTEVCTGESRGGVTYFVLADKAAFQESMDVLFDQFFGVRRITKRERVPEKRDEAELIQLGFWVTKRNKTLSFGNERCISAKSRFDDRLLPMGSSLLTSVDRLPKRQKPAESANEIESRLAAIAPEWENPCLPSMGRSLAVQRPRDQGERLLSKSFRYDTKVLSAMRVIGHVENKLIVVVLDDSIHVIDQHAADERIRLENMLSRIREGDSDSVIKKSPTLNQVRLELTAEEERMYSMTKNVLEFWGWTLRESVSAQSVPRTFEVLSFPRISGMVVDDTAVLHELLQELKDHSESRSVSGVPRVMLRYLATAACRSAIMFGDVLEQDQSISLVQKLRDCDLPFQCAHGRPSIVPLVKFETGSHGGRLDRRPIAERVSSGLAYLRSRNTPLNSSYGIEETQRPTFFKEALKSV